jgi:hypothetical protein
LPWITPCASPRATPCPRRAASTTSHGNASARTIIGLGKADRQAIIDGLQARLKKGDKGLVGSLADRGYPKASGKSFAVDPGKLAEEARFDGISVLAHQCPHHPASYQGSEMLTHQALEMLKRRTGLTKAR